MPARAKRAASSKQAPGRAPSDKRVKAQEAKRGEKAGAKRAVGKTAPQEDPRGGLTAAGRRAYAKKEGSLLKPGVKGKADTPEKMKRKGSFLTRHFTHPRGPMVKDGEPTRLALSAHAWGEPVPKTAAAAAKLAAKGRRLLAAYQKSKEAAAAPRSKRKSTTVKEK